MKNMINWKLFLILLSLSLMSVVCVFPYVMTIQADLLKQINIPILAIFMAQLFQSIILFSIAIILGLLFTKKIGFKIPLLEALVERKNVFSVVKNISTLSFFWGIAVSVTIYGLDTIFSFFGVGVTTHQIIAPVWQTILASVYGGIAEEILMRLFLMTFFIWIGTKMFNQKQPTKIGVIIPIFLVAVIFGLGHLPITASLTSITQLVIGRAIILNGVGGIVFGWLFWKKGLESAIIAHFTADIFLLTLLPLLIK